MLDEFRALGGTAENISLKEGRFGRGLFPCDPSKPVKLHVPESLLVETKHIDFDDNRFRWHEDAPVGAPERVFLESYQRDFSWGVYRGQTEALLRMLAEAPAELRAHLASPLGVSRWLSGPTEAAIRQCYFGARAIRYKGNSVLMPVIELVNHRPDGAIFDREDGIAVSGSFDGEILARYGLTDAFDIFRYWGFASEEQPFALSIGMGVYTQAGEVAIERGDIDLDPKRTPFYPDVKIESGCITLSYMLLGHKSFPELAKANFYRIMRDAGRTDAEELFEKISQINKTEFLKLMAVSEKAAPPLRKLMQDIARIQLDALSCAV